MATQAELEAELALLKAKRAQPGANSAPTGDDGPPGPGWIDALGLKDVDTGELLEQLTKELGNLPQNKPLLTAAAAFGLGFMLGRMSK